jgi:tetratricopeptide (TPR) repeat protein
MLDDIIFIKSLLKCEQFEEANSLIEKAIRTYPDFPDLLNLKAQLLLKIGKLEEAAKIFSGVLECWSNNIEAMNGLGVCKIYQNDFEAAINLFLKILKINPFNEDARENLKFIQNEISKIGDELKTDKERDSR